MREPGIHTSKLVALMGYCLPALVGCTGVIGAGEGTGMAGPGTGGLGSSSGGTSSVDPSGGVGAGTVTSIPGPEGASAMPLRHLTSREYRNTVQAILGDTSIAEDDVPNETSDPTFAYFPFRTTGTVGVVEAEALQ